MRIVDRLEGIVVTKVLEIGNKYDELAVGYREKCGRTVNKTSIDIGLGLVRSTGKVLSRYGSPELALLVSK